MTTSVTVQTATPSVRIDVPQGPSATASVGASPAVSTVASTAPVVDMVFSQGISGPPGEWEVDRAFRLRQLPLEIVDKQVTIDFSEANTYYLLMTDDVTEVRCSSLPEAGVSVRVQLYLEQDSMGGRFISGWPPGTQTPSGLTPILTPDPGALDSIVLDTFDGGRTFQLNVVGQAYLPLAPEV